MLVPIRMMSKNAACKFPRRDLYAAARANKVSGYRPEISARSALYATAMSGRYCPKNGWKRNPMPQALPHKVIDVTLVSRRKPPRHLGDELPEQRKRRYVRAGDVLASTNRVAKTGFLTRIKRKKSSRCASPYANACVSGFLWRNGHQYPKSKTAIVDKCL